MQRNADHREDIEGVLARGAGREAHRHESGDGDQGAGQHGEGQGLVGIGRRRLLGLADGEPPGHGVHRGHGIVDQQGQGDDQGPQRDALQVDVQDVHDGEDGGQDQRDRQRHHGPRPHAEAQEAHRQDDANGLPERGGEIIDRRVDGLRLIGNPGRLDTDGEIRNDRLHGLVDVLAQGQDVAAVAHDDCKPQGVLAVDPEHWLRRIRQAPSDLGDVTEAQHPVADGEIDGQKVRLGAEGPGHAQRDALIAGLDHPGGPHHILGRQGRHQGVGLEAQTGECAHVELDEDALVLGPQDRHLGDIWDPQELGAHLLHVVAQLPVGEAVGGKSVDDAVGVAELVVEARTYEPLRQGVAHVRHLLAHLVPGVLHRLGAGVAGQVDEDGGDAGLGEAAQVVEIRHLLQCALQALGHLQERILQGRPGPGRADHHGAEGERRVLGAPELVEGGDPGRHRDDHQEDHHGAVLDGPFGQVEAAHDLDSASDCAFGAASGAVS